jgi:hypothetical protein
MGASPKPGPLRLDRRHLPQLVGRELDRVLDHRVDDSHPDRIASDLERQQRTNRVRSNPLAGGSALLAAEPSISKRPAT